MKYKLQIGELCKINLPKATKYAKSNFDILAYV